MARKSTRNAQGSGSIRQRPDGRWEARITVGRDPGTGKQIQNSIYGKTQKEVLQKLHSTAVSLDVGEYIEPSRLAVGQWLDVWEKEFIGNVKRTTKISYSQHIKNHIKPALNAVRLQKLNTITIQRFYNKMQSEGLSPKTIKNVHGVLHKALAQAVTLNYIHINPTDNCTLPRVEKVKIKPMDTDEINTFLKAIKGHRFEHLYIVDMFTGMREGEILGLQWSCVDFDKGTILVDKQLQRPRVKGDKYYFASLKNDDTREITPAPFVMQVLKTVKRLQNENRLLTGHQWSDGDFPNLVFTNSFGGHLVYCTVYDAFRELLKKSNLEMHRFHDLRHTYAVNSIRAGDDIKTVQENLGHATAAFTLN